MKDSLPWLAFGGLVLLAVYFVGAEQGAMAVLKDMFVHDGRHFLGFPCH